MTVYASSKAAVRSLVEGLQMECEPLGVKITLVEPAGYMTKFFDNVKNATRMDAYDETYARMQHIFDTAHFGNIPKSMGAVADITGTDQPPQHLAINTDGLTWVRDTQAARLAEYAKWEHVTKETD